MLFSPLGVLAGVTFREETPLGTAFVTTNYVAQDPRQPFETFIRLNYRAGDPVTYNLLRNGQRLDITLKLPDRSIW